jgi:hypothetical protein
MASFLTHEEMAQVEELKKVGVLMPFTQQEVQGLSKNGGVAILCGDGDIDAGLFHRNIVSHRPHGMRIFGGPMVFAPSFRGHDTGLVEGLLRNMSWGRSAKETRAKFLYPHWPCGVGKMFHYSMMEVIHLMREVEEVFLHHSPRVYTFFHVAKKFDDGHEEQNTYRLILDNIQS